MAKSKIVPKKPVARKVNNKPLEKPAVVRSPLARRPKLPWLHKKRYYIPLYIVGFAIIIFLLSLPLLPQAQSVAQGYTIKHPAIAKVVPSTFKPPNVDLPTTGNWLVIPAATIKLPINEGSSISVLNKQIGVWHQTGDVNHNYVIAGHKLQYYRTVNQSLYHLSQLKVGDTGVYVIINGQAMQYRVSQTKIVDKHEVSILNQTTYPELTIYTCNDFFNQRRLTVVAVPIAN